MSDSATARRTDTIPEWKREEVAELVEFLERYQSVGIVDVAGIPSRQLQSMRRDLHGSAEIRMSRNTLTVRALEEIGEGFEELTDYVSGQVAFVGTNDNPFGLYKQLEASKTPAPISAGEVAPDDVVIPEGDTGVDPGPFVGELQQVGAAARIMDGSIHVTEDSSVLEAGEPVSEELEGVLSELGIEPKEVGLDLRGVFSEGVRFEPDELAIDVEEYRSDVASAAAAARNLSVNAVFPTAETTPTLLANAAGDATALGVFAAIEDPDVLPDLIGKADAQVRSIAAEIDDDEALPEELRGVEAPAASAVEADDDEADADEEQTDEDDTAEAEADTDDDDDDDGAEGLGAMFG
ncbi:50S ribosomal protein L10 [Halobellus salinus]|uniref:Large ribosomal subunit protein uL10 n=1 Tax=Halobellus salinus TaxID=931585 RepID=A0A830EFA2_9EURY|nr:50S ribosomal protein L10 [Halobellus salinus]GGJ06270.1 50S ribosomal protein L10 [Halobellus salinus]SMP14479.1 LSU ribosomal protein L10P [Halobellus salinus]